MAYELVEEVLDHAPADLTPAEVLVLVAIAEQARKTTRTAEIPAAALARRARLGEIGLRKACQRLDKRGIKVRVPIRIDRNKQPVYAVPGRHCSYILPPFPAPEGCLCHRCAKAVPGDLLRSKEVPQDQGAIPQDQGAASKGHAPDPTGPPLPSGDPYGVSPDHGTLPAQRARHGPEASAELQRLREKLAGPSKWKQPTAKRAQRPIERLDAAVIQMFPNRQPEPEESSA